MICNNISEFND